jgi:hypothetical protein
VLEQQAQAEAAELAEAADDGHDSDDEAAPSTVDDGSDDEHAWEWDENQDSLYELPSRNDNLA